MNLFGISIEPLDTKTLEAAQARWNQVAKPLGSLGLFETIVSRICALEGTLDISLDRKCLAVVCADNGVVAEQVSASTPEVTRLVAENVAAGTSSVNRMCQAGSIDVYAYDLGMREPCSHPKVRDLRIRAGTANIATGPAMERSEAMRAISAGIDIADQLASLGYEIVGTGEVGIGNTTTSCAVAAALLAKDPAELVGVGAGAAQGGRSHKSRVIERALKMNRPDGDDPIDVLAKVGGLDLCALTGIFLGCAARRTPVVIDGVISSAAALAATRIDEHVAGALVPSHLSSEPAASAIMDELDLVPPIHAGMHLGEGTGAAAVMPLLDMAVSVFQTAATFQSSGIGTNHYDPKAES